MKTNTTPTEAKYSPLPQMRLVDVRAFDNLGYAEELEIDGHTVAHIYPNQDDFGPRILQAVNERESLLADKKELVEALREVLNKHFRWDMMRETGGASERDLALQEMSDAELSARNLLARMDAKVGGES